MNKYIVTKFSKITALIFLFLLIPMSAIFAGEAESALQIKWTSHLQFGSLEALIKGILDALIIIAIPIITLMIIYAGFMYVTARGNVEQTKRATTALTYAIIGGILVIGAVALTGIIEQTVCEFRADGTPGC